MTAPIADDELLAPKRIRELLQHAASGRTTTGIAGEQAPRVFALRAGTPLQTPHGWSERPGGSWR